jgi:hypothetical protein
LATNDAWTKKTWKYYKKHIPPNQRTKKWEHLVRETAERGHKGYYHPSLIGQIQNMETKALDEGKALHEHGPVRYCWLEFADVIGASEGQETKFLLVEHHQAGDFHGHPVTWDELKNKGVKDEDR